jgi:hypothetical protein
MIAPGIYPHLENEDYHRNPDCAALSKGGIDRLLTSPAHYYLQAVGQQAPPTKEMVFGSAFHSLMLQPEQFDSDVEVKASVAVKARNEAAEAGVALITEVELEHLMRMSEALFKFKTAANILEGAQRETSIFWQDDDFDIFCKCRPDILRPELGLVADLKTTKSANPKDFSKACANFNYDTQAAHYLDGTIIALERGFQHFIFIVVEKTPPYAVAAYRANDYMLANGAAKVSAAKRIFKRCARSANWQAYPDKIVDISLPGWAIFEEV